jgi:hypothetical protein
MRQRTDSTRHRWQNGDVNPNARRIRVLTAIKLVHTVIWALLGSCVLAVPVAAAAGWFRGAAVLSAIVVCECALLAANGGCCPLTNIAARFTEERTSNFDIYLPQRFARYNKPIFGSLFIAGGLFALIRWYLALP